MRSIAPALAILMLAAAPAALHATPATSAAAPSQPSQADQVAMVKQVLDQAVTMMFTPGDTDPAWNKGGSDPLRALQARPGHVLLDVDKDGEPTITFFTGKPVAGSLPKEWQLVTEFGQLDAPDNAGLPVEISELEDGYYSVSRTRYRQDGDAFCSSAPAAAQLYRRSGARKGEMSEEAIVFLFRELIERTKGRTVCERYELKDGVYRARYFQADGRSLPFFDQMSGTASIVPQRPPAEMLARAPAQ